MGKTPKVFEMLGFDFSQQPVEIPLGVDDLGMEYAQKAIYRAQQIKPFKFPLFFKLPSEQAPWKFPTEPAISIECKNTIVSRSVYRNKGNSGTIKESWSQDDYKITITGTFLGKDSELKLNDKDPNLKEYPYDDISKLLTYCTAGRAITVLSPIFEAYKINKIVIDTYNFPFTKGNDAQTFTITAKSDNGDTLLSALGSSKKVKVFGKEI